MIFQLDPTGRRSIDSYISDADKELDECGGVFHLEHNLYYLGLQTERCDERNPCPPRVALYARLGLHRYNFLEGRKFELNRVDKYVRSVGSPARTYYMTCYASETQGGGLQTCFEIQVDEYSANQYFLRCPIARIQGDTNPIERKRSHNMDISLPVWPPVNPLSRVKKSEVEENDEWIRLYVELAVAIDRRANEVDFETLKVAMDANVEGLLNAKNATFYISYKDSHRSHRVAIVRRSFLQENGSLDLVGEIRSLDSIQDGQMVFL